MACGDCARRIPPVLRQIWAVSGVMLCVLAQGMAQGYISVLLVALRKPDSPIKVDVHLASWLASGMAVTVIVGNLLSTFLMDFLGRKLAYILGIMPGVTAVILMYSAENFGMILTARLLDGITAGGVVTLGAVIIGEYVSPAYRGMFLNLKSACICLGSAIVHGLGHHFNWRTVALLCLIPYLNALIIILTWPESPSWLASKKRFDESEKAFLWLRGDTAESRAELTDFLRAQKERVSSKIKSNLAGTVRTYFNKLKKKDFIRPVVILVSCTVLMEMCGRHLIPAYVNDIVGSIAGDHGHSIYYTSAIDVIVTISAACSSILIKLMRTRTLLFTSGITSLFVLSITCSYLFLVSHDFISNDMACRLDSMASKSTKSKIKSK